MGPSFLPSGTSNWTPKQEFSSCFGEKRKQANKGNFQLTSVAHERLCLSSIFSVVPVKNSNALVVLYDIETLHMYLMCLSKQMSFFHCNVSLA